MMIDCHAHIYTPAIIANVLTIEGLAAFLHLNVQNVADRTDKAALKRESAAAGVDACLLLPVASASGVHDANTLFLELVDREPSLLTAGAMHPAMAGLDEELKRLDSHGIRALKLSSFTQKFDLASETTLRFFEKIRAHNIACKQKFFVVLDTFYQAHLYFNASKDYLTTPEKLGRLAAQFQEIVFVGAHMGGLAAPFSEIEKYLRPSDNLYLDTSNAAHMLSRDEFIKLLKIHGPEKILFGTDWPWFGHADEAAFIRGLLKETGFSQQEQSLVFGENISRLLGI
jgi:uncharacterized protein